MVTLTRKGGGGEDPTRARPTGYQHTQEGTTTPRTTRRTPSPRRGRLRLWRTPDDGGRKRRRSDGWRATPAADDGLSRTRGRQAGRQTTREHHHHHHPPSPDRDATLPTVLLCSPSLLSRLLDAARLEVDSVALRHDDRKARARTRPTRTADPAPPQLLDRPNRWKGDDDEDDDSSLARYPVWSRDLETSNPKHTPPPRNPIPPHPSLSPPTRKRSRLVESTVQTSPY